MKQRFVALLRRFKLADSDGHRATLDDTGDIQALFNELESLSCDDDDSNNEVDVDTMSVSSTQKPYLRPFFSSSRSLIDNTIGRSDEKLRAINDTEDKDRNYSGGSDNNADQNFTDFDANSDPQTNSPPPKEKFHPDIKEKKSRLFKTAASLSSTSLKKKSSFLSTEPAPSTTPSNAQTTTV